VTGSVTPIYTYWRPAMERIRDYHPGIKLIILLRNPMDRAVLALEHGARSQARAARLHGRSCGGAGAHSRGAAAAATREIVRRSGFYAEQMERVFRFFPREQVHVIKFDDFRTKWRETVDAAFRFVGVEPLANIENKEQNKITYVRRMTPEERRHLYAMYESDIAKLEKLLGWDCSDWKKV
jgi:hypothetical protein